MADPFFAEIRLFGFNFPPYDWAYCNGATISVQQNPALNAIIGTTYGSSSTNTFKLPNIQGCLPVGTDPRGGQPNWTIGTVVGDEAITLTNDSMPLHDHALNGVGPLAPLLQNAPSATNYLARNLVMTTTTTYIPPTGVAPIPMASPMVGAAGGANLNPNGVDSHENRQPYLGLNFCICMNGNWPARPS